MKGSFIFLIVAARPIFALWPIPRSLQAGDNLVKLSPDFQIQYAMPRPPQDLLDAVSRTIARLRSDKLQRLVVGRGESDSQRLPNAPSLTSLSLSLATTAGPVQSIMQEATKEITTRSEEYSLSVPNGGVATVVANSTLGLFRGLTTFEQLWYDDSTGVTYTYQAPVTIVNDSPAYPYRGFMLDTARNFFPVADIKRTLDAMSMVKMSQFHWHAVDSQSFPLSIPGFPQLAQKGAYSAQEIYSDSDIQDIVNYAGARGIDVLMARCFKNFSVSLPVLKQFV
ncbi:unnamed protein product [Cyclocybe aegerita]|uniref:beta-N-acetylhexosaminidase n=1 Tax=Cyclocybe aegerita TaxID=1973307 RepID=A0A8S0W417_CYCAE|nr:unnamed protein product [Cyclocybe aegerita]